MSVTSVGWSWATFQSRFGIFEADGWSTDDIPCPDRARIYRRFDVTRESTSADDPDFIPQSYTSTVTVDSGAIYNDFGFPSPNTETGDVTGLTTPPAINSYVSDGNFSGSVSFESGGYNYTESYTLIFSNPVDVAFLRSEALALLELEDWIENGECVSTYAVTFKNCNSVATEEPENAILVQSRFRWQVPDDHTGTWFQATWDVYFFPETGDPVMISEDNVEEWEGPGTGDQDDESWLFPLWHTLEAPEEPGEIRVVNIRFECYRGPYGTKPQITGEGYTPPEP
jgi:hypothetical protein